MDRRSLVLAALALALLLGTLLALHGYVLGWPFISDDYIFLSDTWHGSLKNLLGAFNTVQNYFRPLGRELYFFVLSLVAANDPRFFRCVNLSFLIVMIGLVMALAWRFGGPRAGLLAGAGYTLLYPHRVELAWVSCSQDLIATLLALVATLAFLRGRQLLAGASLFLALFAKESVAPLPLVLLVWEAWNSSARARLAVAVRSALRATAPLWIATAAWGAVVVAVRLWRHAWAPGSSLPVADVTLRLGNLWEGFRSALLTYVYVDQPWTYLREAMGRIQIPWVGIVLLALTAASAFLLPRRDRSGAPDSGPGAGARLGLLWATVGVLPVALVGHHFSAYYVCFSAVGFALLAGLGLARAPLALVIVAFGAAATLNTVANAVETFRFYSNEDDLPGVSYVTVARLGYQARYLDSLYSAMRRDPPPRGAVVYVSHAPHQAGLATAGDRAPRIWFHDPTLEFTTIGQYRPGADSRPKRFLRYDLAHLSFASLPESLMRLIVEGEDHMSRGDWPAARAAFGRALDLARPGVQDLERIEISNSIGVAANHEGDTATARRAWDAALSLDPNHRGALLNRAGLDATSGRYGEAKRLIERLLETKPTDSLGLLYLARLERALGNGAGAGRAWARLVASNPAFADSIARSDGTP